MTTSSSSSPNASSTSVTAGSTSNDGFDHIFVNSSDVTIHCVVAVPGDEKEPRGTVVMIHGFPELWYSWRHQMPTLSAAGYRSIAIDVRGYGRSGIPHDIEAYAMTSLVGDVIAVLDHFGCDTAAVVGHDWGAPVAWNTALLRPDRVSGVAGLSVPYSPRGDTRPLDAFRSLSRTLSPDETFYIDYFQEPGLVEAEVEPDLGGWLRGFYFSASAEADLTAPSMGFVPPGRPMRERFQQPTDGQMAWMQPVDFDYYVNEFTRTGLTGGFNRYRNITRDWHELAPWRYAPITVPALFIGGDVDGPTMLGADAIGRFDVNLPNLTRSAILSGCGHWVQQEKPNEVNELLIDFLEGL